jgi:hypothetical protein
MNDLAGRRQRHLESHTGAFDQARDRRRSNRITPFTGEHTVLRLPRHHHNLN